jgi:putative membrane protein
MICITLSIILAISAIYEIIEWLVAKIVGRSAKSFLATQGDVWDSQWDMSLTFIGAILSLLLLSKLHNRIMNKELK